MAQLTHDIPRFPIASCATLGWVCWECNALPLLSRRVRMIAIPSFLRCVYIYICYYTLVHVSNPELSTQFTHMAWDDDTLEADTHTKKT